MHEEGEMDRSVMGAARRLAPAVVLVIAGLAAAPTMAADRGVSIAGFAFDPSTITVHVGDAVTWMNSDGVAHSATGDGGTFDTGLLSSGRTSSAMRFGTAGTYPYHCKVHASMLGTVVVTDASTPPPTDTLQPAAPTGSGVPWALLAVAALAGLEIGRRRFGRREDGGELPGL
jgi:plastocyanin